MHQNIFDVDYLQKRKHLNFLLKFTTNSSISITCIDEESVLRLYIVLLIRSGYYEWPNG